MEVIPTEIPDVIEIRPSVHKDTRGYFFESFRKEIIQKSLGKINFVQENESMSSYGVLRGLHFQKPPHAQSKLVRVIDGMVLDVAVDIRKDSNYYGKHITVKLDSQQKNQLFIPRGFAHGFIVLSKTAAFAYKCDNYYAPGFESGIIWNDDYLSINWGIEPEKIIISSKDSQLPKLGEIDNFQTFD